jgi:hypothetical protein
VNGTSQFTGRLDLWRVTNIDEKYIALSINLWTSAGGNRGAATLAASSSSFTLVGMG